MPIRRPIKDMDSIKNNKAPRNCICRGALFLIVLKYNLLILGYS